MCLECSIESLAELVDADRPAFSRAVSAESPSLDETDDEADSKECEKSIEKSSWTTCGASGAAPTEARRVSAASCGALARGTASADRAALARAPALRSPSELNEVEPRSEDEPARRSVRARCGATRDETAGEARSAAPGVLRGLCDANDRR